MSLSLAKSYLALALGAATVLAFAPFGLRSLAWLTLGGLFLLWHDASTPRQAAWRGFAFGFGLFALGVPWLFIALHDYGGMAAPLAALAIALFCAYLALFPAFAGWAFARLRSGCEVRDLLLLAPGLWMLSEWLRGSLFSGFPWLTLGYAELPRSPLLGWAPVVGVYGLSLAVALLSGFIAWLIQAEATLRQRLLALAPALLLLVLGAFLQSIPWSQPVGEPLRVSLLQGNIPQDQKFDIREFRRTLETYLRLATESRAQLIVSAESAVPALLEDAPPRFLERLENHAKEQGGDVLLGVFTQDPITHAFHNSVLSLGDSPTQQYRKVHLVPFGETIPLKPLFGWIFEHFLAIPLDDQGRGETYQRPLQVAGQRVAVNICYEDVFGEEIILQLPEATLLVNVTNDAWYGRSIAARQHNQIAQMRALETSRVLLRATNTGVSAVIDERGRVVSSLPEFTEGRLEATVQGRAGRTPFVFWGNGLALGLGILLLAWTVLRKRSPSR